jgi:hypothetical protein
MQYRKFIIAALAAGIVALAPSQASAASSCSTGMRSFDTTRGGYTVQYKSYTSQRGMACSSVRYVMNRWIRPKVRRQWSWPHVIGPFYDGYVAWTCYKIARHRVECAEFQSNTLFRFTAVVW